MKKLELNFKAIYVFIGVLYMFLSASLFAKGLMNSMSEFKVPDLVLQSAHYYDAILWVYVHMIVIGLLILLLGISVTDFNKQKWISSILFLVTSFYTYLDFKSADWTYGNSLYQGESSLIPGIIGLIVNILFLYNAISLFKSSDK
ncbi:MAG: hypothetical protein ACOVP1_10830 [Bacteroidia bacterium]